MAIDTEAMKQALRTGVQTKAWVFVAVFVVGMIAGGFVRGMF